MYDRHFAEEINRIREYAHKQQNARNARRRAEGKHKIDSFPKEVFKLPKDLTILKTFYVYDELPQLRKMSMPELLQYFFKNAIIYGANLIFNENFALKYFITTVKVSKSDYNSIFNPKKYKLPKDCTVKDNYLNFRFSLEYLKSLNSACAKGKADNNEAKAKQYVLFNFFVVYDFLKTFGAYSKDFILFILERYHYKKEPVIKHSFTSMLKASGISLHESKKAALNRINKYFNFLVENDLISSGRFFKFTEEDFEITAAINMQLNRIDFYS